MKWLTNIYNPSLPDAAQMLVLSHNENPQEAWRHHLKWLSDKSIGDPQATPQMSVAKLKQENIVGVYTITEEVTQ